MKFKLNEEVEYLEQDINGKITIDQREFNFKHPFYPSNSERLSWASIKLINKETIVKNNLNRRSEKFLEAIQEFKTALENKDLFTICLYLRCLLTIPINSDISRTYVNLFKLYQHAESSRAENSLKPAQIIFYCHCLEFFTDNIAMQKSIITAMQADQILTKLEYDPASYTQGYLLTRVKTYLNVASTTEKLLKELEKEINNKLLTLETYRQENNAVENGTLETFKPESSKPF